ncbi:MAG: DinB family protein [Armatimonadota bacterium]|nr:DinB family protein [Armatimonadota bacterium]
MAQILQEFVTAATQKAAADLEAAMLRLPEDKRSWSPMDKARTALDQAAECALINGYTAEMIASRKWNMGDDMSSFEQEKDKLKQDWSAVKSVLDQNIAKLVAAIRSVPDEDLGHEIQMPWGPMSMAQIIAYPYWNMAYHEGQINYISSMVGCL